VNTRSLLSVHVAQFKCLLSGTANGSVGSRGDVVPLGDTCALLWAVPAATHGYAKKKRPVIISRRGLVSAGGWQARASRHHPDGLPGLSLGHDADCEC